MKLHRLHIAAFAAAAILALGSTVAFAQPAGEHPHHGGPGGMEIEHLLLHLKSQLNLNTSQQLMWDNAVAQTKAAGAAGRANMQKLHDAVASQLANAAPDLAAIGTVSDSVQADNQTLRQGVRAQWLKIYATFSPEQKAVVRDALAKHMARMDAMRAKMLSHMQGGS